METSIKNHAVQIFTASAVGIGLLISSASIALAESPLGCDADTSYVNISKDKSAAANGEIITFTVTAGNDAGANGCDIENRDMTLMLPDGSSQTFGPFDYTYGSAEAFVGEAQYTADTADLDGVIWTASVNWDGTLKDIVDQPSNGDKQVSVLSVMPLKVSKTATPATKINYEWDITKSVTPETWNLFNGDSGTSEYTIDLVKSVSSVVDTVTGSITIMNPNPSLPATIEGLTDTIEGYGVVNTTCDDMLPYNLAAGETLTCTYETELPDDSTRLNTATVVTSGIVPGDEGTAFIDFSRVIPTEMNTEIDVDDTFAAGDKTGINNSTSYSYTHTFMCADDEGTVDNTATIAGTTISDSASVMINCYELAVEKTAAGTFDRTWDWDITKNADTTELMLENGQSASVGYTVDVDATATDSNYMVSGDITITNPHPTREADITDVIDELDGAFPTINCGGASTVPAQEEIVCSYGPIATEAALNEATVTQQNYNYDQTGTASVAGTSNYNADTSVSYTGPVTETDECIDVTDTLAGDLGQVCASEGNTSFEFMYGLSYGTENTNDIVLECGETRTPNTASFVSTDTNQSGMADEVVTSNVECLALAGCTPGYWKNNWWSDTTNADGLYGSVFSTPASYGDETLLEALKAKGGGWKALIRHATAAYLNATVLGDGYGYPLSGDEVVHAVNSLGENASKRDINHLKDQFDKYNNLGCSLNAHGDVTGT